MTDQMKKPPVDCTLDVFGKTPFEYELTAEPVNGPTLAGWRLAGSGSWHTTTRTVFTVPALPSWMNPGRTR